MTLRQAFPVYLPIKNLVRATALATPLLLGASPAFTADGPGAKCTGIADRIARLACFDDVFQTPVAPPNPVIDAPALTPNQPGPIRQTATQVEAMRMPGDPSWVVRMRPWREDALLSVPDYTARPGYDPESVDVYMTMREAGSVSGTASEKPASEQALLLLSCENNITTLGVLLPKRIDSLQANLSLSGDRGSVFQLNWRDAENGDVVIAGRGLESIDTIKAIANYSRVQLQVAYPDGARAFVFDIGDLLEKAKPLRTACHW